VATPKTVGQFYVETSRQTAKTAASAQDAAGRLLDEMARVSQAYYAAWTAAQNNSMQTAFQLQNAAIEASQTLSKATIQANLSLFDEWVKMVSTGQEAASKLAAASLAIAESAVTRRAG
jgi:hypothetical protein